MRHAIQFTLIVIIAGMVGCGGGNQPLPAGNQAPETPTQFAGEFPTALPQDSVQPWEELDANGNVVPEGNKGVSATSESSEFFAGTQTDSKSGDTSSWNGALRMASGNVGAGNLSYAIYRIPLGGTEPGVVSVDANLRPMNDGKLSGYYVGLADYGNDSWQWFGPISDAHWRISSVQAAREAANYTSGLGNVYVCVVAHDGAALDIVGVGIDPVDPGDTDAPPAPPTPSLTPVPGGLLVDWTAFAGSDIAGYKVYYKDSAYTDLTAFSANTLGTLHDSLLRLSLDEYTPRTWWVAVSTIDLSGNESATSPVVSARPLPAESGVPPVWIELDNATALINQPLVMTATGAETYDWDTNGDGVFDILGDATGTQNVDTSQAGIIRPLVRGNSSGGSFIALGAVSVVVTSNARPVVQGFVDPAFGPAPLTVQFTSTQVDIDGDLVEYIWDFTSNGGVNFRFSTAGGATDPAPYTFTTPGLYNAKVRAWDDDGAWDVDTVTVQVTGNLPPVADISSSSEHLLGVPITFDAQQSFDLDGTIEQYEWDLDGDGSFEYDSTPDEFASVTFPIPGYKNVGLRVTDNLGAQGETIFQLTVHGVLPLALDSADAVGEHTSLAVVNGNPAICYYDDTNDDLKYIRATDPDGTLWGAPIVVDAGGKVGQYSSLAVVNGNPAISYYDWENGDLKFVRAANADGSSWDVPQSLDFGGAVGLHTSLAVVNGNPAISYFDDVTDDLKYIRATNPNGSAWATATSPVTTNSVGHFSSLVVAAGNPAIAYLDGSFGDLYYVRATDSTGTAWGVPKRLDDIGNVGSYLSMAIVQGKPGISYYDATNGNLKFIRAENAEGSLWGFAQVLDSDGDVGSRTSLAIINGFPAISYYKATSVDLRFIIANHPSGSSWEAPRTVDETDFVGWYSSLADVNGKPAMSYFYITGNDLRYAVLY